MQPPTPSPPNIYSLPHHYFYSERNDGSMNNEVNRLLHIYKEKLEELQEELTRSILLQEYGLEIDLYNDTELELLLKGILYDLETNPETPENDFDLFDEDFMEKFLGHDLG